MRKNTHQRNYGCPETLQEFIEEMKKPEGKYLHLKIILYRDANKFKMELGQRFLFINDNGFGIYLQKTVKLTT